MEAEVKKRLFTVEEYHQMAEAGILREDDRVELIDGEIIQMSPIGHRHRLSHDEIGPAWSRSCQAGPGPHPRVTLATRRCGCGSKGSTGSRS